MYVISQVITCPGLVIRRDLGLARITQGPLRQNNWHILNSGSFSACVCANKEMADPEYINPQISECFKGADQMAKFNLMNFQLYSLDLVSSNTIFKRDQPKTQQLKKSQFLKNISGNLPNMMPNPLTKASYEARNNEIPTTLSHCTYYSAS